MDLTKLFKTQAELDKKIIEEKGLQGQDLLDKKILALQVELGELANEWRGFKFWSEDQESNTEYVCELCEDRKEISALTDTGSVGETYEVYDVYEVDIECPLCEGYDNDKNPLLEEYVDCLHFILSIGNDLKFERQTARSFKNGNSIMGQFHSVYSELSSLYYHRQMYNYERALNLIIGLGELLGFTWEQIEQAYYQKNKINHERQSNGY